MKTCQYINCKEKVTNRIDFSKQTGIGPRFSVYLCKEHAAEIKRVMKGKTNVARKTKSRRTNRA